MTKATIVKHIEDLLNQRLSLLEKEIQSLQSSAANETKSSMGDKYETARAQAHLELEKLAKRLAETKQLKLILKQAELPTQNNTIAFGSMAHTSNGVFFIACGIGRVEFEGQVVFVVSPSAPVAKLLLNKKVGDTAVLNGNSIKINQIEG